MAVLVNSGAKHNFISADVGNSFGQDRRIRSGDWSGTVHERGGDFPRSGLVLAGHRSGGGFSSRRTRKL